MASPAAAPALAERADIHKSCKSIETLLNILNEYCEAASAVVSLQKKLAKALRETAGLKVTTDIAANAMNASATIFEALSDIDAKFSKVADKEYDAVSTEVKKWFKKLAKEERLHDERMANANAKIKQAGQAYEKKSKKKAIDASEEHARYINLISTLGPEVSQEKYNHTLNVTQRHNTTTFSVAACLSRLADTEWQKSCECVRRFSPTIGPLGQWRSLCEGGWTGQVPPDLPDIDDGASQPNPPGNGDTIDRPPVGLTPIGEETPRQPSQPQAVPPAQLTPEPQERPPLSSYPTSAQSASETSNDTSRDQVSARSSPTLTRQQQLPATTQTTPSETAQALATPQQTTLRPPVTPYVDHNAGSVRSLSDFPSPPTHFPLPPPRQPASRQTSYFQQTPSSANLEPPPSSQQRTDSPLSSTGDLSGVSDNEEPTSPTIQNLRDVPTSTTTSTQASPETQFKAPKIPEEQMSREQQPQPQSNTQDIQRPIPTRSQTALTVDSNLEHETRHSPGPSSSVEATNSQASSRSYNRDAYEPDTREFGTLNREGDASTRSRTVDNSKYQRPVERTDTGASSGSIVAAMRNRYSNNSGSTSPPPRDLPRLPLSVNDLASRYQPSDAPLSPRARAGSPPVMRQQSLPLLETAARQAQESYNPRTPTQPERNAENERRWQQQRNEDAVIAERRAKEQELRERERELEMKARELERERARLQTLREEERGEDQGAYREPGPSEMNQFGLRPRERRISLRQQAQRPTSRDDVGQSQYANNLGPPRSPGGQAYQSSGQQGRSPKLAERSPLQSQPESPYDSRDRDRYASNNGYGSNANSTAPSASAHAAYCGCETCSVSKYKSSNGGGTSPVQQQPYRQQYSPVENIAQPQKSSKLGVGWMRRLSMPVGSAFGGNSDSKRHQSNNSTSSINSQYALGSGVGNAPNSGTRGFFSMDGKKNASTTALSSPAYNNPGGNANDPRGLMVQEDGRYGRGGGAGRRSLEASGISNRSMTNLGMSGRQ